LSEHRHRTPLRGTEVTPRPQPDNPEYTAVNYRYAGQTGHIHEVVEIGGRELVKVGFDDRKIVYYFMRISNAMMARTSARFTTCPNSGQMDCACRSFR